MVDGFRGAQVPLQVDLHRKVVDVLKCVANGIIRVAADLKNLRESELVLDDLVHFAIEDSDAEEQQEGLARDVCPEHLPEVHGVVEVELALERHKDPAEAEVHVVGLVAF